MRRCLFLFAIAACGETTLTPPAQLNLDRPMDIAFACYGGMRVTDGRTTGMVTDPVVISPQPTSACEIRSTMRRPDEVPVIPGQEDLTDAGGIALPPSTWFGFVLQSGPGTVALAQFAAKPTDQFNPGTEEVFINDADPLTPIKNSISVGEDPIAIATDSAGCKVLTANAGSCDLSVLDIATAVDADASTPIDVQRLEVKTASGAPMRSRPAAMQAEPSIEVYGNACQATASGLVYIAYPSCHLVAGVDVSTGTIVTGIQFDAAGIPTIVDGNVSCPDECGGGATITPGPRPVTIDVEKDVRTGERRLIIGADNSPAITIVELADATNLPESTRQITLEGDVGVTHLALSPTIGMGGFVGLINDDTATGGQFQFVYAIATDQTVRVLDVLDIFRECDTQIDPRYLRGIRSVRELSCLSLTDPDTPGLLRRAGAKGPGIELVGDGVPLSLDIVKAQEFFDDSGAPSAVPEDPDRPVGYYAIVSATNGLNFVINIDDDGRRDLFELDDPITVPMPLVLAHQVRDSISNRDRQSELEGQILCEPAPTTEEIITGGPRTTQNPGRTVPNNIFAPEKVTTLPGIRQERCEGVDLAGKATVRGVSELSFAASEVTRDLAYPDLMALRSEETWTLTWEGNVSLDRDDTSEDGPPIRESEILVDAIGGMRIVDQSKPFCDAGVQDYDIVQLRGCDPAFGDGDCPTGYRCFVHPDSQVSGIGACMLDDEAERLADACKDYLTSLRRYTVATTKSGTLGLLPRRHTLRTTPLDGCVSNEQCDALADYAAKNSNSLHPVDDDATDERTWTCQADPLRAPVEGTGNRCQLRCDATADCVGGTICQGGTPGSGTKAGFCMEGVVPPQACVNAPQRYEVLVAEAFSVVGERSGFIHNVTADAAGNCIEDTTEPNSQLLTGRIPLNPPDCAADADPLTGRRPDGTFEANPCRTTVTQAELVPLYIAGTCSLQNPPSEVRERQAPALRFRTRGITMNIVDPTYPGDQTCILDRLGVPGTNTTEIPQVFGGYQILFRQTAGFLSKTLPIGPTFPVKVVRGPGDSIWVIDEGDFLSTSISQASTRGRVFRVEPSLRASYSAE